MTPGRWRSTDGMTRQVICFGAVPIDECAGERKGRLHLVTASHAGPISTRLLLRSSNQAADGAYKLRDPFASWRCAVGAATWRALMTAEELNWRSRASAAAIDGASPGIGRDTAALTELFRQHHLELVRLAALLVRSREAGEDIVQDVFINI